MFRTGTVTWLETHPMLRGLLAWVNRELFDTDTASFKDLACLVGGNMDGKHTIFDTRRKSFGDVLDPYVAPSRQDETELRSSFLAERGVRDAPVAVSGDTLTSRTAVSSRKS